MTASWRESWKRYRAFASLEVVAEDAASYWSIYGGWGALLRSPALWAAGVLAGAAFPVFRGGRWIDATFSTVPTVMGFSLSAMAIILALPATKLFEIIAEDGRPDSYFLDLTSKLVHFVVIQTISLIVALLGRAWDVWPLALFGTWLLIYSILTAALLSIALYGTARMFNHSARPRGQPFAETDEK